MIFSDSETKDTYLLDFNIFARIGLGKQAQWPQEEWVISRLATKSRQFGGRVKGPKTMSLQVRAYDSLTMGRPNWDTGEDGKAETNYLSLQS